MKEIQNTSQEVQTTTQGTPMGRVSAPLALPADLCLCTVLRWPHRQPDDHCPACDGYRGCSCESAQVEHTVDAAASLPASAGATALRTGLPKRPGRAIQSQAFPFPCAGYLRYPF
jgi:hypothetical protein